MVGNNHGSRKCFGGKAHRRKIEYKIASYSIEEKDPKTPNSFRTLRMSAVVEREVIRRQQIVEAHKELLLDNYEDNGYISCQPNGKPHGLSSMNTALTRLCMRNGLSDIRWHDLRATYCTILLKNDFNPKAVSKLMGHAKEIITIDVYGDKQEIIEDCLEVLEPFIDEVIPEEEEEFDLSAMDYMDSVALELAI